MTLFCVPLQNDYTLRVSLGLMALIGKVLAKIGIVRHSQGCNKR